MAAGKWNTQTVSPIVSAIQNARQGTSTEIHVFLSQRQIEGSLYKRADHIFNEWIVSSPGNRSKPMNSAILFYLNLRHKKFAIIASPEITQKLGNPFIEKLVLELQQNLRFTQNERAIAKTIDFLAVKLKSTLPIIPFRVSKS